VGVLAWGSECVWGVSTGAPFFLGVPPGTLQCLCEITGLAEVHVFRATPVPGTVLLWTWTAEGPHDARPIAHLSYTGAHFEVLVPTAPAAAQVRDRSSGPPSPSPPVSAVPRVEYASSCVCLQAPRACRDGEGLAGGCGPPGAAFPLRAPFAREHRGQVPSVLAAREQATVEEAQMRKRVRRVSPPARAPPQLLGQWLHGPPLVPGLSRGRPVGPAPGSMAPPPPSQPPLPSVVPVATPPLTHPEAPQAPSSCVGTFLALCRRRSSYPRLD
jgi:hypothetical protein